MIKIKTLNLKALLGFVFLCLLLFSCKTNNLKTNKPIDINQPIYKNMAFFTTIQQKSDFKQVKISSKINVETGNFIPKLDATIYIENGKKIWANISALFFNAARAEITPHGIKAFEKWNKTYIDSDFGYFNQLLNVNFINYDALQNLLVGKTFMPVNDVEFTLTENASGYNLVSNKNQKVMVNGKITEYKVSLDYDKNYNLNHVLIQDPSSPDTLDVYYTDWTDIESQKFPQNVKIIIKAAKSSQIFIENTKFDFSEMNTPFEIPDNYTKKEIK